MLGGYLGEDVVYNVVAVMHLQVNAGVWFFGILLHFHIVRTRMLSTCPQTQTVQYICTSCTFSSNIDRYFLTLGAIRLHLPAIGAQLWDLPKGQSPFTFLNSLR